MELPPEEQAALERVVESGSGLAGAGTGAVIGTVIGGPPGALAGAGVGWAVEELLRVGADVSRRWLSPRAEGRVGAVLRLAADEMSARIMAGETPRDDLRAEVTPGRTQAAELVEATLRTASQSYEERKVPYLAHLLVGIALEPDLSHAHAHQLIATAEELTYRQLLVLDVLASRTDGDHLRFRGSVGDGRDEAEAERLSVCADMLDLFRRGLLNVYRHRYGDGYESMRLGDDRDRAPWPSIPQEMSPVDTRASASGARLQRLMRLDLAPAQDKDALVLAHIGR
jgi:hypothetical protein